MAELTPTWVHCFYDDGPTCGAKSPEVWSNGKLTTQEMDAAAIRVHNAGPRGGGK